MVMLRLVSRCPRSMVPNWESAHREARALKNLHSQDLDPGLARPHRPQLLLLADPSRMTSFPKRTLTNLTLVHTSNKVGKIARGALYWLCLPLIC